MTDGHIQRKPDSYPTDCGQIVLVVCYGQRSIHDRRSYPTEAGVTSDWLWTECSCCVLHFVRCSEPKLCCLRRKIIGITGDVFFGTRYPLRDSLSRYYCCREWTSVQERFNSSRTAPTLRCLGVPSSRASLVLPLDERWLGWFPTFCVCLSFSTICYYCGRMKMCWRSLICSAACNRVLALWFDLRKSFNRCIWYLYYGFILK